MKAAERAFLQKGVEQTTIEDITYGADVSKGAFYLHFSSKADVLEALRQSFIQELLDKIVAQVSSQDSNDWRGKLKAWSQACALGYLDAARLHHLVFESAPPPSREGLTRNGLIDHLAELLVRGNRSDAWALADPSFTAVFLFNALHGVINQNGVAGSVANRETLLSHIDDHFQRSIGPARSKDRRHSA